MVLDFDLRPGDGVGPFQIGASLWDVLSFLRQPPWNTIFSSIEIKFDIDVPTTSVIIVLIHPYVDLLFSGHGQRLHTIACRRLRHGLPAPPSQHSEHSESNESSVPPATIGASTLVLRYGDVILSSPNEVLRRGGVSRAFGPTYELDTMRYPGVSFTFEDDRSGTIMLPGSPRPRSTEPDKRVEVKRILITQSIEPSDAFQEVHQCPIMHGEIQRAVVQPHEGIILHFYPSPSTPLAVKLGVTASEDLQCELGPPLQVYYKDDTRISIHSPRSRHRNSEKDYFMNYFHHGIDFLIDGEAHIVKKIILHTNTIHTLDFQRYKRCPWEIQTPSSLSDEPQENIMFYDPLEKIFRSLGPSGSGEKPLTMHLDRPEDELIALSSSYTNLIGFDGIVLEATTSGHVSTVLIY